MCGEKQLLPSIELLFVEDLKRKCLHGNSNNRSHQLMLTGVDHWFVAAPISRGKDSFSVKIFDRIPRERNIDNPSVRPSLSEIDSARTWSGCSQYLR